MEATNSTKSHKEQKIVDWLKGRMRTLWASPRHCALCLATDGQFFSLSMEFTGNEETSTKPLRDVVNYVFNFDIEDYMPSDHLCEQCTEKTLQTYIFVTNVKKTFTILNSCINDLHSKVTDINNTLDDNVTYEDSNVMIVIEYDNETSKQIAELASGDSAIITDKPRFIQNNDLVTPQVKTVPLVVATPRVVKHPRTKDMAKKQIVETKPTPSVSSEGGKIVIAPLVVRNQPSAPRFNTYCCNSCTDIFTTYRSLKEHEKVKHNSVIFKCRFCSKIYNTRQYLDVHYMSLHGKSRCRFCQDLFKSDHLNKHLREQHVNLVYCCTECDLVYYSMEQLETHVKSGHWKLVLPMKSKRQCIMCLKHLRENEITSHKCKFSCLECPKVPCVHFSYLMSYREQVLNHMTLIQCLDCDFKTKRKEQLIAHVNREHLDYHPYTCDECKTQFYTKLSLKTHITQFHQDLKCQYCDSEFKTTNMLQSHRSICKTFSRQFTCVQCVASFDTQSELDTHAQDSHSGLVYPCTLCKKEFGKENLLEEHHMRIHSSIQYKKRRKFIECTLCDINFKNIKEMLEHEKIHISKEFPCKVCPKTFSTLKKVYLHKQRHYSQKVKCEGCKKLVAVSYFSQHKALCPSLKGKFACEICKKRFESELAFKSHSLLHGVSEPCIHCGKMIKPSSMKKHIDFKHNAYADDALPSKQQLYPCDDCGYVVRKMTDLENHVNKVHLKIKPYVCDFCGKQFCGKSRLAEHVRTHSTDNVCFCQHCGKKFANKVCLKMHVRRHTGENPYECNICFEKFRSSSIMKTHRLKRHQDKTIACPLCDSMYHLVAEMRFHVKKVHWKSKEPFDYTKIVPEEHYHLFKDRRLQKLGGDSLELATY